MNVSQTLQTNCGHIEDVHVFFYLELETILRELWPFKLSLADFCTIGYYRV